MDGCGFCRWYILVNYFSVQTPIYVWYVWYDMIHDICTYHRRIIPNTHSVHPQLTLRPPRAISHKTTSPTRRQSPPPSQDRSRDGYIMAGALKRSSPPSAAQKKRKAEAPENRWPVSPYFIIRRALRAQQQYIVALRVLLCPIPPHLSSSTPGTCVRVPSICTAV